MSDAMVSARPATIPSKRIAWTLILVCRFSVSITSTRRNGRTISRTSTRNPDSIPAPTEKPHPRTMGDAVSLRARRRGRRRLLRSEPSRRPRQAGTTSLLRGRRRLRQGSRRIPADDAPQRHLSQPLVDGPPSRDIVAGKPPLLREHRPRPLCHPRMRPNHPRRTRDLQRRTLPPASSFFITDSSVWIQMACRWASSPERNYPVTQHAPHDGRVPRPLLRRHHRSQQSIRRRLPARTLVRSLREPLQHRRHAMCRAVIHDLGHFRSAGLEPLTM